MQVAIAGRVQGRREPVVVGKAEALFGKAAEGRQQEILEQRVAEIRTLLLDPPQLVARLNHWALKDWEAGYHQGAEMGRRDCERRMMQIDEQLTCAIVKARQRLEATDLTGEIKTPPAPSESVEG